MLVLLVFKFLLEFQHMLEDWTTASCPIIHHFVGSLTNLPSCPIFLHCLDKNFVKGSSILEEPWTAARLSKVSAYAGRLDNCILSNPSTFWRKPGQLAKLSNFPALCRQHFVQGSSILEEPWTAARLSKVPACAGRMDNSTLSNLSAFWSKPGQLARLCMLPAFLEED